MLIFVFALEVSFAGINVPFVSVVGVVLNFIFGHSITSLVESLIVVWIQFCMGIRYDMWRNRQCELVERVVIGKNYPCGEAVCSQDRDRLLPARRGESVGVRISRIMADSQELL